MRVRVVSLSCRNLFDAQPAEYREAVLPPEAPMLAVETGVSLAWRPYVGPEIAMMGVNPFSASASGVTVM